MSDVMPVFSAAPIPDGPEDVAPETTHEYSCKTCGKELEYSGRGRRPQYCADHRRSAAGDGRAKRPGLGKQDVLAAQAVEALVQINGLVAIGLMLAGLPVTADAMANAKDSFRVTAYEALLTDPALCALIVRGGTSSGKIALAISYGMLGAAVIPVGVMEVKARRAAVVVDGV